ncbi:MAG: formate dehydrogenase accessory sulfurtransferase FdhD [Chloroflexi bacterium]|nr:formate dehydrogenase accessory sulfurtransferase FdhD [Chloroflexota bacterium]
MKRTLVIGYGNRDREDDGAGWHLLNLFARHLNLPSPELPGDSSVSPDGSVRLTYLFQLLPEMAEDIAEYNRVFFLDAHNSEKLDELVFEQIFPKHTQSAFTHHLAAEELLALTQTLGRKAPEAWIVSVRGHSFRFQRELTDQTAQSVQLALKKMVEAFAEPSSSFSDAAKEFAYVHYQAADHLFTDAQKPVVSEHACRLIVNGEAWITFICSPIDLEALALGFLWNENVISELSEVLDMKLSDDRAQLSINLKSQTHKPVSFHRTSTGVTPDSARNDTPSASDFKISATQIMELYRLFTKAQTMHDKVGGFHSAALSDGASMRIVVEDLGRHNCVDKLAGQFLLQNRPFTPHLIALSGRISSEMVAKSLALSVEFIVSRTSPTSLAIETAKQLGITLIGYLRGGQFDIYSHAERVIRDA